MQLGLLLAIVAFPLLELAVLLWAGRAIGVWPVLGIVVGTAILGLLVLRWQGFTIVRRTVQAVRAGEPPAQTMLDSAATCVGGLLLITPGLIADALGLLLLVPPVRTGVASWLASGLGAWGGQVRVFRIRRRPEDGETKPPPGRGPVIDEVNSMRPYRCAFMGGRAARAALKAPRRLTATTRSQSPGLVSSISCQG